MEYEPRRRQDPVIECGGHLMDNDDTMPMLRDLMEPAQEGCKIYQILEDPLAPELEGFEAFSYKEIEMHPDDEGIESDMEVESRRAREHGRYLPAPYTYNSCILDRIRRFERKDINTDVDEIAEDSSDHSDGTDSFEDIASSSDTAYDADSSVQGVSLTATSAATTYDDKRGRSLQPIRFSLKKRTVDAVEYEDTALGSNNEQCSNFGADRVTKKARRLSNL